MNKISRFSLANCQTKTVISECSSRLFTTTRTFFKYKRLPRSLMFVRPDKAEIDAMVAKGLKDEEYTYRKHPGSCNMGSISAPIAFERALVKYSADINLNSLKAEAKKLREKLESRQTVWTGDKTRQKFEELLCREADLLAERKIEQMKSEVGGSPTDEELYGYVQQQKQSLEGKVQKKLQRLIYNWQPMNYKNKARCLTYALSRFSADYATLYRVFNEIKSRDPNFCPRSVFDFGSGIGSTIWATEHVWNSERATKRMDGRKKVEEPCRRTYFCVDVSASMLDIAGALLRDGDPNGALCPPFQRTDVFFRQFLPAAHEPTYDLVVSAFSMLEIGTYEERMRTALNLWHKTNDYLVLIEIGNRYGYTILMEIRDHILAGGREIFRKELKNLLSENCPQIDQSFIDRILKKQGNQNDDQKMAQVKQLLVEMIKEHPSYESKIRRVVDSLADVPNLLPVGHVVAPCPHDSFCPRLRDVVPCKFEQKYFELMPSGHEKGEPKRSTFSYLVLRKGKRQSTDTLEQGKDITSGFEHGGDWPRLVRPVLIRKGHLLCEMCTKNGFLSEWTPTKKSTDNNIYYTLKKSDWGDLLPVKLDFSQRRFDEMKERFLQFQQKLAEPEGQNNRAGDGRATLEDEDILDGFQNDEETTEKCQDDESVNDDRQRANI